MDRVHTRQTAHDGPLYRDDSITVLLDPTHNHREVIAFGAAVGGVTGEGRCTPGTAPDVTWRCAWDVAVARGADRWTVEMALPLSLWRTPPDDSTWAGFDVVRFRYARREISRWSGATAPGATAPGATAAPTEASWYDPIALGDLCFRLPELRLSAIALDGVAQGQHPFRLVVSNRSAQALPAELTLVTRSLGAPSHSLTYQFHAPPQQAQQLRLTVPVVGDHDNELSVTLRAQGRGSGAYRCAYPLTVRGLRVPGLGVVTVEADRAFLPPDRYVATWTLPDHAVAARGWQVSAELRDPSMRVIRRTAPVGLAARSTTVVVPLESLPDGVYQVGARVVDGGGVTVASGSWSIACLRAMHEHLGLESLARQVRALGARLPKDPTWSRATALPGLSVELAHQALRDISPADLADGRALAAHWAGQARRDIELLGQRMLPLGGKRGELLRAYRSDVDGSLQAYRVYVPQAYKPGESIPLVVVLHDRAPSYRKDQALIGRDAVAAAESAGVLLMAPFGRGNTGYRFVGARDVFDALADLSVFYRVDPARVYMMGVGAGGGGAWYLGLTRPDRFAAIAAIAAPADARLDAPADPSAAQWQALHQTNPYDYLDNAMHVPAYIVHGAQDRVVPVAHARRMAAGLAERGYAHVYRELPQDGHRRFGEHYAAIFRWFVGHRIPAHPRRFEFVTWWLGHHEAYGVSIVRRADAALRSKVWGRVDATTLHVDTENVTELSLVRGAEKVDRDEALHVRVDGTTFEPLKPPLGPLRFCRSASGWRRGPAAVSGLGKRPGLQGPIADALSGPMLVVMGTAGTDTSAQAAARHAVGEFARWWSAERLGTLRVKADQQVTPGDHRRYHLICFGGPDTNAVVRALADRLPVRLTADAVELGGRSLSATGLGLRLVYPNPDAPTRYVVVQASRDARVLSALSQVGGAYDFVVVRPSGRQSVDVLLSGFFDARWQPAGAADAPTSRAGAPAR